MWVEMVNRKEIRLTPFQGYDNPLYAALELDYGESDEDPTGEARDATQKFLTFYELDLGLNHVVRKWSEPTDRRANMLVQGGSSFVSQFSWSLADILQCPEVRMPSQIDGKDHLVCWSAVRITSFGSTWMPMRTECLYPDGVIHSLSETTPVGESSSLLQSCTRSR